MLRLMLLALAGILGPAAVRPDVQASEAELKAAWIYNFAQHVEWPASAFKNDKAPLVIGVLGAAAVEEPLGRAVRGKQAQGRAVEIRRAAQPADLKGVHIAFVPDADKDRLDQVLAAVQGSPVLVVGESAGLCRHGAAFNFYSDEARVRFEANVETATHAGLSVGSKLLKFARLVKD